MDRILSLTSLRSFHAHLLWNDIVAAAAAVLDTTGEMPQVEFAIEYQDVPGFGSDEVVLGIDASDVARQDVDRMRRTYESPRLVELAAIAVAGLALYHGGGHEILDVSVRGTAADYLVDSSLALLEVAGRSRRGDFESTWRQKQTRLEQRGQNDYYVCVVEFETLSGRLAYVQ